MEQIDLEHVRVLSPFRNLSPSENKGARAWQAPKRFSRTSSADVDFEIAALLSLRCPPHIIAQLKRDAETANVSLIEVAIASGIYRAEHFYGHLSRKLSLAEREAPCRLRLAAPEQAWKLLDKPIPLAAYDDDVVAMNGQGFSIKTLMTLAVKLGDKRKRLKLLTRQDLIDLVTRSHGAHLVGRAVSGLMRARPDWSAKTGLAAWQGYFGSALLGLVIGALALAPRETLIVGAMGLSIFFLLATALRLMAVITLLWPAPQQKRRLPRLLSDADLPRYTVLVPLYKEVEILPYLASALKKIHYPPAKLDIKIILESVDTDTIAAASRLDFPGNVDLIIVPDREPRTKPKALNYALQFATGALAVIYDAEDRPEPDQLRKAATAFHCASPELACVQARLDYFNARENWLSRQFTIEYATLFRGLLPLFSRFGFPVPLGGTSNHFRIDVLRALHAWDPFNVTEDADLGMRLQRAGYKVEMLDSTTYEEGLLPLRGLGQTAHALA